MKKTELIVLATMAVIFAGPGSLAWGKGAPKDISVPGNTVVHDPEEDLLLAPCDDPEAGGICSYLSDTVVPGYADIEVARITEVGRDQVDLSITPNELIPAEPAEDYLAYYWQFQDVCSSDNSPTDKEAMVITWKKAEGEEGKWSANWVKIESCTPRVISLHDVAKITFEEGGVAVRASLNDLLTTEGSPLKWFAGVRLLSASNTLPVDVVPVVMELDSNATPLILNVYPENYATWESH